jgi:hypothetical protein
MTALAIRIDAAQAAGPSLPFLRHTPETRCCDRFDSLLNVSVPTAPLKGLSSLKKINPVGL